MKDREIEIGIDKKERGIMYPYLPEGREIKYAFPGNIYMILARWFAQKYSLDKTMPGAVVIVKNNRIIGIGTNGSNYHKEHECQKVLLKCKTGEGYELCEGCHPKNHSETQAIAFAEVYARYYGFKIKDADLYLWGHWWCCKSCWDKMIEAGIRIVYLLLDSEKLFNKEHPENIVGRQFE